MTVKPFTQDHAISTGDVYVDESYISYYGAKVIDYTWVRVNGVEKKFFFLQSGRVRENKFDTSQGSVFSASEKVISEGYTFIWTPDEVPAFQPGDILKSKDGKLFYFESKSQVWRLDGSRNFGSTFGSLAARISEHGELEVWTTSSGDPFRDVIERSLDLS